MRRWLVVLRGALTGVGFPGYAWCARRSALQQVGFYSRAVVGGFDALLVHTLLKEQQCAARMNDAMAQHFEQWAARARRVLAPGVTPLPAQVGALHLWHGDKAKRMYVERHEILLRGGYDPVADVELTAQGVLRWTASANRSMVAQVAQMFQVRHVP